MKNKLLKYGIFIIVLFFAFQSVVNIASADDHYKGDRYYYPKYEKSDKNNYFEKFDKHDHDDDDDDYKWKGEYEQEGNYKNLQQNTVQPSYWNVWTRDTHISISNNLPVEEAKKVSFNLNGKTEKLLVFPSNGQLLVSGEKMAKLFGIKSKYYEQSRILELSNGQEELIVRAGTNAAYENMVKTPMPAKALSYEKTVYLPISVIANAFGYSVDWDEANETFILEQFY
ncbi:copper amine oxidase N-terminal domain-containing protein [Ureibacillus thermophilus]|uniref:Copper amine oxidase N-terminal domain-containing protein n=1 Tax=Ureibacillus thermophilus TaxID=367743 RepID=A0A4P6USG3_9BACL|nr:copper amine oxidase N-terminal domain-containing protein [Ureibacillus thermophilus]QBK24472.1 copper amine oxidase N-terminal domain-containing protein [Ureibacillus thermophilus]